MNTKYIYPSRISSLVKLNRLLLGKDYVDSKKFIMVDANTYENCIPTLISRVSALEGASFFEVPVGEEAKSVEVAVQLWQALVESEADRDSVIINLGGGCVSDIGGFVAAGYKRGIRYINVPTSLLAMVDASMGGKTAVNIEGVKNQVGFFHQPEAVCFFPAFLETLPEEELVSGLFEMVKTLMLFDAGSYNTLLQLLTSSDSEMDDSTLGEYISQCAEFKRSVVAHDPYEKSVRKILNFGHTFGHAIESYSSEQGKQLPHGMAVGIGIACELYLSHKKLRMSVEEYNKFHCLLDSLVGIPKYKLRDAETILNYMRNDKKSRDGVIMCTLLREIGLPVIDVSINENEVRDTLLSISKNKASL